MAGLSAQICHRVTSRPRVAMLLQKRRRVVLRLSCIKVASGRGNDSALNLQRTQAIIGMY